MACDDNAIMQVTSEEEFIRNYKAVYNAMTAKPDCRSKAYPHEVIVELDDIFDLHNIIVEKFRTQYDDAGFSINVIVSIKGRQKLEFPNWRSFSEHKWTESEIITGIVLMWEFNVILPKYKVPQKHTLMVKLSNGIRPEEMLAIVVSGKLDEIEEIDQSVCPIVARMDFIDPGIGNEVLELVSDWVKGLKNSGSEKGKITLFLQHNKRKVAYALNYLTTLFAMICSLKYIKYFILQIPANIISEMTTTQLNDLINVFFACTILCICVYKVTDFISNVVFKTLAEYGEEHVFDITKGDKKQQDKLRKQERKDRIKILSNLLFTILINIICGIVTYFFTKGM